MQSAISTAAQVTPITSIDVYTFGSGGRKQATKVTDKRVGGGPAKLSDLGFKDGMEVLAERNVDERGKVRQRPLAFDEANKRDKARACRCGG